MNPGSLHQAYLDAPPENQWRGRLPALWKHLEETSERLAPGWTFVVLPHGARVGMRKPESGPRELVILRREPFKAKNGEAFWIAEVTTFRREFGILNWTPERGNTKEGGPKVTFRETVRAMDFFTEEG
jgi:hypothetical protein